MRLVRSLLAVLTVAYAFGLLALIVALRYLGERWWVTGTALYLPRLPLLVPLPALALAAFATRLPPPFWAPLVAALPLLVVLLGFVPPVPHASVAHAGGAGEVRVLSYNIDSAHGGPDAIVAEIERYSPDVVLLQEIAAVERLKQLLRPRYATVQVDGQFFLATRYRVARTVEPEKIEQGGHKRPAQFVKYVLETPAGPLTVYNVHPISPRPALEHVRGQGLRHELLNGHVFSSEHAAVFEENAELRALQIRAFSEDAAREAGPVVIAGDTNLPSLSLLLGRYLSRFQDGFSKAGWGFGYTFPRHHGPWMRIDRVFANDRLRFVGFTVGSSRASDHMCVVADLEPAPR